MAAEIWVALLYSVVLGPGRRLGMGPLRDMAGELGLADARTVAATGNLVFRGDGPATALERRLETAFAARFGRHVDIIVRDAAGWRRLAAGNPFAAEGDAAPASVHVRVMRAPVGADAAARVAAARSGDERLAVVDGDIWLHLPAGVPMSRLAVAASRTGVGTFRNWNTVRRLRETVEADAAL